VKDDGVAASGIKGMSCGVNTLSRSCSSLSLNRLPQCGERARDDTFGKTPRSTPLKIPDNILFQNPVMVWVEQVQGYGCDLREWEKGV
jgi:hypothetical protein